MKLTTIRQTAHLWNVITAQGQHVGNIQFFDDVDQDVAAVTVQTMIARHNEFEPGGMANPSTPPKDDKPRFAVVVDQGLVVDVISSDPTLIGASYATIDFDTEGLSGDDEVTFVPPISQDYPDEEREAFVRTHTVEAALSDVGNVESWVTKTAAEIEAEQDAAERAGARVDGADRDNLGESPDC
jgi:hypothetical protein